MLSSGSAASVGVDPQIVLVDLHVHILLNIRHHVQGHKGGLTLPLGVKRGNPHKPVYTLLGFQITVGIGSIDLEGH